MTTKPTHSFGTSLRARRKAAGLSVYALARRVELTDQAVANIEAGADPKLSTALSLAAALGCSVDEMASEKIRKKSQNSS